MRLCEKKIDSTLLYESATFRFLLDEVELPDGRQVQREMVKHPGGVGVLAIDEHQRCAMVCQYRYPIQQVTCEIPAGKLSQKETPLACAARELREETGFLADAWEYLGKIYPSPGIVDEVLYLFLAQGLHSGQQQLDADEFIDLSWIHLGELLAQISAGKVTDCKTLCALQLAQAQGKLPKMEPEAQHL